MDLHSKLILFITNLIITPKSINLAEMMIDAKGDINCEMRRISPYLKYVFLTFLITISALSALLS